MLRDAHFVRSSARAPHEAIHSAASWKSSVGGTGADQIAVAIGVIDPVDRPPVFFSRRNAAGKAGLHA